ncbi:Hsp70 family protein [Desulfococcus sp.]|uniref:Hsp70 family protein n=1 Tax=Desulfococcus sp. TaxID=2025834 RepID=UPI0035935F5D
MSYERMAVDFGTSNTIVAFWNESRNDVDLYGVKDVSRPFRFRQDGRETEIPCIPSLIYYRDAETSFIGQQVVGMMLERSRGSFRWMKAFIQERRRIKYPMDDGTQIDHFQAGRDFMEKVLAYSAQAGRLDLSACEVAFTVPVEAFEHYTDWLAVVCSDLGIRRYRFIDESSACIFGYDTHLQPGDLFLIFDLGGGTLDISVVRIEERVSNRGCGCRIMGKAGCGIGGRNIDGWLYADLLNRACIQPLDARPASALFMREVEQLKECLTDHVSREYDIRHEPSGLRLKGEYDRSTLEDLLEERGLFRDVQQTLERALKDAYERGVEKSAIREALLVGGSSQIPSIRRLVRTHFGERTRYYRPFDAVARGACRYLSNDIEALYDHIQHDYAIKGYDSGSGTHRFIPLVPQGTHYPTDEGFRRMTLKATRDGQRFFGIDIYEVADRGSVRGGAAGEIVFDLNGNALYDDSARPAAGSTEFWINEEKPTFIEADPPAKGGVKRFAVSFRVDAFKHLLVTVRDLQTQKLVYDDHPVVKLK